MGQDQDREITYLLPAWSNRFDLEKTDLIYCQVELDGEKQDRTKNTDTGRLGTRAMVSW